MNRNTYYAEILVDELARSGLRHVVLVPGSRHTPLVLAFAEHPALTVHSHLDERSAAFYALGLALVTNQPVAIACTSGTAAANFYPAIIEAHQSRVPLIVLTADRPPELRHSGANQTIDQIKIYGDYVLWAVDAALPEADPSPVAVRNLRTLANRAYAVADGIRKGVVHINVPFRKPLEPTPVSTDTRPPASPRRDGQPFTRTPPGHASHDTKTARALFDLLKTHENGWIIAGRRCDAFGLPALAEASRYPLLCDVVAHLPYVNDYVVRGYESFLMAAPSAFPPPDVVIRFGDLPVSKWLGDYLNAHPPAHYIHISPDGVWSDDAHLVTDFIQADATRLCADLIALTGKNPLRTQTPPLLEVERRTWSAIDSALTTVDDFDGAFVYDAFDVSPEKTLFFIGNSLSIRHVDQFTRPQRKRQRVFANRGASGIDGNISTALGIGAGRQDDARLVAIVGDITFYHDMNGLLAIQRCGVPVTLIVMNNDGGGIFHRLPIRAHEPHFTDYFITPHGLDFQHAAKLYGLAYVRTDDRATFRDALRTSIESGGSTLIEVHTGATDDLTRRGAIMAAVRDALDDTFTGD